MEGKMKALRQYGPYDNRLEEIEIPKIGKKGMLLKVSACGICAGDVKAYHGGIRIWGTSEANRYIEPPVTGGHEFFGEIVELGEERTDFQIGDRVVAEQIVPCWDCEFCQKGKYWMCKGSAVYGFKQHAQGGFAEYISVHENSIVHKVPDSFTLEQGALVEPIACGMHALEMADIQHDDIVIIAGLGAIGTSMVNMAKLRLPKILIGLDVKEARLQKGLEYGADYTLNPMDPDFEQKIMEITGGHGCDVYVEASGSQASVNQGLNFLCNHGRYVQMGVFAQEVKADWNVIGDGKELTIKGSHLSALTFKSVIDGISSGLIKTEGLVTHKFALEDWKKGFETAEGTDDALKVILVNE